MSVGGKYCSCRPGIDPGCHDCQLPDGSYMREKTFRSSSNSSSHTSSSKKSEEGVSVWGCLITIFIILAVLSMIGQ